MLVADSVVGVPHRVQRDLAVVMRQGNQLAPRMLFRRAAFVRINVGVLAAQHRVIRPVQSLQCENVRARTVEGEENINSRPEMLFEFRQCRARVRVVAVSHHVPLISPRNRLQNFRMHPGIIVAGKITSRLR